MTLPRESLIRLAAAMAATAALLIPPPSGAADRYVSPSGISGGQGTLAAPWSLSWAVSPGNNVLQPGETVYLRGGVYSGTQRYDFSKSGVVGSPIIYRAYQAEIPILDGTLAGPALLDDGNRYGLVRFNNTAFVTLQNVKVRSFRTTNSSDSVGILITGAAHHLSILGCEVSNITTSKADPDDTIGNANGIGVYGTNPTISCNNILIDGCSVHNLVTGLSESVVFNGNVDGFAITNSSVFSCNNIGIDCIGYEGVAGGVSDRARNGLIQGNQVFQIDSSTNPAYAGDISAGGIYVDGGGSITIERNRVSGCNIGIELASENPGRSTSNCRVRNNWIWQNHIGGIFLGGAEITNGQATNNVITNNVLWSNDVLNTSNGEIMFQNFATNNVVKHNIIYASDQKVFITNPTATSVSGNTIDWNIYYSASGATTSALSKWRWVNVERQNFSTWKTVTGFDSHSVVVDPMMVSLSGSLNFRLKTGSPAINAGDPAFVPQVDEQDIDGDPRKIGPKVDIGSDEFGTVVNIAAIDAAAAETGDAAAFTITRGSASATALSVALSIGGSASNGTDYATLVQTVTIPAGQSTATVAVIPALDSLAEGDEQITLTVVPTANYEAGAQNSATATLQDSPMDQWRAAQFGSDAGNESIAGNTADADGDGLPNLVKYILGTNPTVRTVASLPAVAIEGGHLTITVARSADPADASLLAEVSSDGLAWGSGPGKILVLTDTATQFKAHDVSFANTFQRRMIRLKATRP